MRTSRNAAPGVVQFIDQTSLFMTLVGLTSLLVGGIGVANGVRAWLDARARGIATLRCLGASPALVFTICLMQVMALSAAGVAIGLVAGAALPAVAVWALHDVLPVAPETGPFAVPLIQAAAYGMLTAATFALWPLARAMRISGAALFRDPLLPSRVPMRGRLLAVNAALAAALVGLTVATATNRSFAAYFCRLRTGDAAAVPGGRQCRDVGRGGAAAQPFCLGAARHRQPLSARVRRRP